MDKKRFYNKKTIILFIIITIILLPLGHMKGYRMTDSGSQGIPLTYKSWGFMEEAKTNYPALIANIIIYYILALGIILIKERKTKSYQK